VTSNTRQRLALAPLGLALLALLLVSGSGRLGAGFARYSGLFAVVLGMVSGQLIRTFLPQRIRDAPPNGAIAEGTELAIMLIACLLALCLVGVVGAAIR
jgi:hypothetical protein